MLFSLFLITTFSSTMTLEVNYALHSTTKGGWLALLKSKWKQKLDYFTLDGLGT